MHKKIYNETIYKDSLYKQIKNILGDPKAFIKSRRDRKEIIYYKLKELTLFNDYSNFFNSKNQYSLKGFDQEKQDFVKIYYEAMEALIKRSDSAELKNQIRLSVNTIMQYCKKNGYIDSDDIFTITYVTNKIKPEELFDILLKIAVSSTSYVNIEENEINYNDISRVIFVNNFAKSFIIYLFYLILEDNPQVSSILCIIYPDIPNIMNGFDSKKHKQYFTKLSLQLIIIFNKVFNIEEKIINYTDDKNNYKTLTFLTLPDKISDLVIPPTHLPEIMEPNVEYNNLSDIINFSKSIKNGFSNVELGQKTKKALIISQNKSFKINRNAIILFKKLDESPYSETKDLDLLPFTPIPHFIYLEDKIKDIESNIGFDTMGKIVNYYKEEVKGKYVDDLESKITSDLNITSEEYKLSQELYMLRKEYKKKIKLRILHNTIIKMAEIFEGFPIYYINAYDFRLRMYPWNYMFNRTSGIYKYMLEEHRQMVSVNGLKVMIKAYFKENPEQINQFENLTNKEEIINLFNKIENIDSIKPIDSFFYKKLLGYEIKNLKLNKFRSGFMIEIDQKSSASVILSLVFGDEILARESNLSSDLEMKDINNFIMERSVEWFKGEVTDETLEILSHSRKMHKYLFMCFIYNETLWGRIKRVRSYINNDNDILLIASKYPDFLNSIFPSIFNKRNIFNKIIKYYIENSQKKIEIETLDGSLISWFIFKKIESKINTKIKVLNPITKEKFSYHYQTYDTSEVNLKKTILGMLPNFIHSIDGAIMRLIILDVNERLKYTINHLHDSIQFHPNHYDEIKQSILNVYTSSELEDIIEKRLFVKLRINLLEEKRSGFDELVEKFYNCDYHKIKVSENLKIENMFPYE